MRSASEILLFDKEKLREVNSSSVVRAPRLRKADRVCSVMLVAFIQLLWEHLHHGNWQMLQTSVFPQEELLKHSPACHYIYSVCIYTHTHTCIHLHVPINGGKCSAHHKELLKHSPAYQHIYIYNGNSIFFLKTFPDIFVITFCCGFFLCFIIHEHTQTHPHPQ